MHSIFVLLAYSTVTLCLCPDPAAENFNYPVSIDVRELISLQDVMEELDLGPNGCVEYKFYLLSTVLHESS